jgi:hypothetical protein
VLYFGSYGVRGPAGGKKVIKPGNVGDVHYFEHESGSVAGVKFFPRTVIP